MREWSVHIETAAGEPGAVSSEHIDRLVEALARYHGALGGAQDGSNIGASMTFEGSDIREVTDESMRVFEKALIEVGLEDLSIEWIEIKTMEALDRQIETPLYPELVGVTEIAEILGVSRQRASALTANPQFPRPLADLAAGPVWPVDWITRFVEEWRRRPGRPAKVPAKTVRTVATVGDGTSKHVDARTRR